jgi:hypothetical protein
MTKSTVLAKDATSAVLREVRPFLYLEPARLPLAATTVDAAGCARLEASVSPVIPQLVRSLVDFTIALQNRRALERGNVQPIQLSVLNRRRRAARAWILAILGGQNDAATQHAVSTQWIPVLTGTGPELARAEASGRALVEFVRGAITACIFDEPSDNLLEHCKALHVLETTLAVHLAALQQVVRAATK